MNEDDVLRLGLPGLCVVFMPMAAYHRIRAHTGEKLDRWQEGPVILIGLRLTGLAMATAGLAWLINPAWMAWSSLPLPVWLRAVGLILAASAGCLFVWAVHHLGKNLTDTVVTRKEHTRVTSGPYRWVRHPFYTACLLAFVGSSLVMANWFIFLTGAVGMCFLIARTRIEEAKLVDRFGDDYRDLMARTGRFVPRLR